MTSMYDDNGVRVPVTVLQVRFTFTRVIRLGPSVFSLQLENCQVTANIKTVRPDQTEYHAVQVAASDRPPKTTTAQMRGHFRKARVHPKRIVKEFPITPDAHIPIGEGHGRSWDPSPGLILPTTQAPRSPLFTLFRANMWMLLLNREQGGIIT